MIKVLIDSIKAEGYLIRVVDNLRIIWLDLFVSKSISEDILVRIRMDKIKDFTLPGLNYEVTFMGADFLIDYQTLTVANHDRLIKYNHELSTLSEPIPLELIREPFYRHFGYHNLNFELIYGEAIKVKYQMS